MRLLLFFVLACFSLSAQTRLYTVGGGGGGSIAERVTAGTYANLPGSPEEGDLHLITSGVYDFARYDGAAWDVFMEGVEITVPLATGWTTVGAGTTPTVSHTNGYISLYSNNDDDWAAYLRAVPADPYTLRTFVRFTGSEDDVQFGIGWANGTAADDESTFIHIQWDITSAPRLRYQVSQLNALDPATSAGPLTNYAFADWDPLLSNRGIWIELGDNSTNRTIRISVDGINWYSWLSYSRTTHITPTHVGIFVERSVNDTSIIVGDWTVD